jgi:hypothetical protein
MPMAIRSSTMTILYIPSPEIARRHIGSSLSVILCKKGR